MRRFKSVAVLEEAYRMAQQAVRKKNKDELIHTNLSQFVSVAVVESAKRVLEDAR